MLKDKTVHSLNHPKDCLHDIVYSTNAKVNQHSETMLSTLKVPLETLKANDKKTHDFKDFNPKNDPRFTGGLPDEIDQPDEIIVALGAKYHVDTKC